VTAYTFAGAVTSTLVGGGLGYLGGIFASGLGGSAGLACALAVGIVAFTREAELVRIPLPQVPRQTQGLWAKTWGGTGATVLWGLDLGLVFTTWLNFSGIWLLTAVALVTGQPSFGAALFGAYWLGRALSVWIAPLLVSSATDTAQLMVTFDEQRRLFKAAHVGALAWAVAVLGALIATGTTL
jgi:hypothetical protein